jgi:hypothetical protein
VSVRGFIFENSGVSQFTYDREIFKTDEGTAGAGLKLERRMGALAALEKGAQ